DLRPTPTPTPFPWGPPGSGFCTDLGSPVASAPRELCNGVDGLLLEYVVGYTDADDPAIWTIPPVALTPTQCAGLQFDSLNHLPEGPACFVVAARDNAGNHAVSPPLRVCIDRGGGSCNSWPPGTPPSCLGTYDRATRKTNSTPCTL